jgi:hypothetical protein
MLTFTLRHVSEDRRLSYGLLYESVETVDVTGRAAHSRHHPHRAQVWDSEQRTGGCGTRILSAEAIVIAATPVERSPHLGTVAEGDRVRLVFPGGYTVEELVVTAQPLRDPKLVPADAA